MSAFAQKDLTGLRRFSEDPKKDSKRLCTNQCDLVELVHFRNKANTLEVTSKASVKMSVLKGSLSTAVLFVGLMSKSK